MTADFDPASGNGFRPEPPALTAAADRGAVPVVRDAGFARLSPTSFRLWSVPNESGGRVEIVFQRLARREVAQEVGNALPPVGREVRMEVAELGSIELSRDALSALREEIDRHLGEAPRHEPSSDAAARQLLASARSELAGVQDQLGEKIDDLSRKVDAWGGRMTSLRAELARDLEQLVRLLWPKDRVRK